MLVAIIVRRGRAPSKRTPPSDGDELRRNERRLKARLRIKGHHAARPRGALIATRTRTPSQRRHRVACPRGAMIRPYTPPSDQHPTGINPDVMASEPRSHAGCDYRPTETSSVETNTAVRRGRAPSKRTPPSDGDELRRNEHRLKARLRIKGHHAARPRGALIETRTRTPSQRRHRVPGMSKRILKRLASFRTPSPIAYVQRATCA